MKPSLKPGLKHSFSYQVPETKTVPYLYAESPQLQAMPEVFATGFMVGLMEWTCVQLLEPHLDRLRRRSDYRAGAPWQLFRTGLARAPHRVIWPDLARRLQAAVPASDVVPLNTVYGIVTRTADDAHALAALLNSRWLTALARLRADPARGGFGRFNASVVRELPTPPGDSLAWRTLAALGRRRTADDDTVAELLQLDIADRRALSPLAPDSF